MQLSIEKGPGARLHLPGKEAEKFIKWRLKNNNQLKCKTYKYKLGIGGPVFLVIRYEKFSSNLTVVSEVMYGYEGIKIIGTTSDIDSFKRAIKKHNLKFIGNTIVKT